MKKQFTKRGRLIRAVSLFAVLVMIIASMSGCSKKESFDYQFQEPKEGDTVAILHTTMGDITFRFFEKEAPKAVENFVTHAKAGYYDGVQFFDVISDFMIETGDPTNSGLGGESIWGKGFEDETVPYLSPYYGSVCMANLGAYKNPSSNTSLFFIVTSKDTDTSMLENANDYADKAEKVADEKVQMYQKIGGAMWLDEQIGTLYETQYNYTAGIHTVFGQVIDGMDVAEAISQVGTYTKEQEDNAKIEDKNETDILENKPVDPVTVTSVEITAYKKGMMTIDYLNMDNSKAKTVSGGENSQDSGN